MGNTIIFFYEELIMSKGEINQGLKIIFFLFSENYKTVNLLMDYINIKILFSQ